MTMVHGLAGDADPGLPLRLGSCSNGEYPAPVTGELATEAMRRARHDADGAGRRLGWSRRRFLVSSAGLASGLAALQACNDEHARSRDTEPGGTFAVPTTATTDVEEATTVVHGDDDDPITVVDVQTHFLESGEFGVGFPQAQCGEDEPIDCLGVGYWRDLVLGGSDTAVAVISAVPVVGDADPLSIEAMERGRRAGDELCGDERVLIQGHAVPDVGPLGAALESMAQIADEHALCAWKVYTHSPGGWYLDDHEPDAPQIGAAFINAARDTGVPVVAVHKGLAGGNPYASPVDIGPAAAANRDVAFLVYHSGYEPAVTEGPYDPQGGGVDRLVRSVSQSGIGQRGNVYAELGSTWRTLMGSPDEAAHVLGKLLVAFGPDRILWGTDSIWYGSPQDQIAAFRTFEISESFQERFGYPALTKDVKRRILGENAIELFGIDAPTTPCTPSETAGIRAGLATPNRVHGPQSRRDVLATFWREHPWAAGDVPWLPR
ncbi:MAG: amidohydrolase [Actinomycetota bacterium]|nr:amidohydrolase [Actinomycetota bacterium]